MHVCCGKLAGVVVGVLSPLFSFVLEFQFSCISLPMLRGTLTRFGRSSAPRSEEFGKVLELVPVGSGIDKFDG